MGDNAKLVEEARKYREDIVERCGGVVCLCEKGQVTRCAPCIISDLATALETAGEEKERVICDEPIITDSESGEMRLKTSVTLANKYRLENIALRAKLDKAVEGKETAERCNETLCGKMRIDYVSCGGRLLFSTPMQFKRLHDNGEYFIHDFGGDTVQKGEGIQRVNGNNHGERGGLAQKKGGGGKKG